MGKSIEAIISLMEKRGRPLSDDNDTSRRLVAAECLNALLEDDRSSGFLYWVDYLVENESTINNKGGIDFSFPDDISAGFNLIVRILSVEECKLLVKEIVLGGIEDEKSEIDSQKALALASLIIIFNVDVRDLYNSCKKDRNFLRVINYNYYGR